MRRLIGTKVVAARVALGSPAGYTRVAVPARFGRIQGYVIAGPDNDMTTTVYLLPNDDGSWFRDMVTRAGGTVREEES